MSFIITKLIFILLILLITHSNECYHYPLNIYSFEFTHYKFKWGLSLPNQYNFFWVYSLHIQMSVITKNTISIILSLLIKKIAMSFIVTDSISILLSSLITNSNEFYRYPVNIHSFWVHKCTDYSCKWVLSLRMQYQFFWVYP